MVFRGGFHLFIWLLKVFRGGLNLLIRVLEVFRGVLNLFMRMLWLGGCFSCFWFERIERKNQGVNWEMVFLYYVLK